jgi:hypothetical protein
VDCNAGPDSDKEGFAALVQELSIAFKTKGLLLSSAVSPSKVVIDVGKKKLNYIYYVTIAFLKYINKYNCARNTMKLVSEKHFTSTT